MITKWLQFHKTNMKGITLLQHYFEYTRNFFQRKDRPPLFRLIVTTSTPEIAVSHVYRFSQMLTQTLQFSNPKFHLNLNLQNEEIQIYFKIAFAIFRSSKTDSSIIIFLLVNSYDISESKGNNNIL